MRKVAFEYYESSGSKLGNVELPHHCFEGSSMFSGLYKSGMALTARRMSLLMTVFLTWGIVSVDFDMIGVGFMVVSGFTCLNGFCRIFRQINFPYQIVLY